MVTPFQVRGEKPACRGIKRGSRIVAGRSSPLQIAKDLGFQTGVGSGRLGGKAKQVNRGNGLTDAGLAVLAASFQVIAQFRRGLLRECAEHEEFVEFF